MSDLHLRDLDSDGALGDAFDRLHGRTRSDLLRGALVGGAALLAAFAAPARPGPKRRTRATSRSSTSC